MKTCKKISYFAAGDCLTVGDLKHFLDSCKLDESSSIEVIEYDDEGRIIDSNCFMSMCTYHDMQDKSDGNGLILVRDHFLSSELVTKIQSHWITPSELIDIMSKLNIKGLT